MKFTKESLVRATRTFIQSVVAYISVNFVVVDFTNEKETIKSTMLALIVSALAGGISAVMNMENREDDDNDI